MAEAPEKKKEERGSKEKPRRPRPMDRKPSRSYQKSDKMSDKTAIPSRLKFKKKVCRFCSGSLKEAGYRDYEALKRFTSDRGKILPRRITGCCAKHQRKVSKAIKQARNLALLPYVAE